jgi:uncharacterized protein YndB with AHSA1/START domain
MSHVEHTTFEIVRDLPGSPAHAFRFWSDQAMKERWNGCHPDWTVLEDRFDFRPGGHEAKRWRTPDGAELTFNAHYLDIVAGERIVYAYEMSFGGERLSASLVTVILTAQGKGCRMTLTEQAVFFTPGSRDQRVAGTEEGYDRLVAVMEAAGAPVQ